MPWRSPAPCCSETSAKLRGSLRDGLDERDFAELITTHREGRYGRLPRLSLKNGEPLLHLAGLYRTSSTPRATNTTPTATDPGHSCPAFNAPTTAKENIAPDDSA
jgi:hypothetical protein